MSDILIRNPDGTTCFKDLCDVVQECGAGTQHIGVTADMCAVDLCQAITDCGTATPPNITLISNEGAPICLADFCTEFTLCNQPPVAVITGPTTSSTGSAVTLSASSSTDPNDVIVTYTWAQAGGTPISVTGPANGITIDLVMPTVTADEDVTVWLQVTDSFGATDTTTHVITVQAVVNTPPTAVITGPTVTANGNSFTLDGTTSSDPEDGNVTTYTWTQISGPTVVIPTGTASTTGAILAPTVAVDTPMQFQLCVTDAQGLQDCTTHDVTAKAAGECADADLTLAKADSDLRDGYIEAGTQTPDGVNAGSVLGGIGAGEHTMGYLPDWHVPTNGTADYLVPNMSFPNITAFGTSITFPTPSGENAGIGFIFNSSDPFGNAIEEYYAQVLTTPLVAGTTYRMTMAVGGGTHRDPTQGTDAGNRQIVIYGSDSAINQEQISNGGVITTYSGGANGNIVELDRDTVPVSGVAWGYVSFEFTPTQNITTLIVGGASTEARGPSNSQGEKYVVTGELLLAPKDDWVCP